MQQALFGGGCFWCVEAVFRQLKGVEQVTSGYAGGTTVEPSYEAVCTGETLHAEVIQINFDETQVTYKQLLEVLFAIHDPTTLNRQGNDIGTQYRSVIFYQNEQQLQDANAVIETLKAMDLDIVTEVSPVPTFYAAEEHHQNFFEKNPAQGYCNFSIPPKLLKLRSKFNDLMKTD